MTNSALRSQIDFSTIDRFLDSCAANYGDRVAFSIIEGNLWQELKFDSLRERSRKFAQALNTRGLKKGDKIAILSEARLEWPIAIFGTLLSGATLVPLDNKLTQTELESILRHVGAGTIIASKQFLRLAEELKLTCPHIKRVLTLEDGSQAGRVSFVSAAENSASSQSVGIEPAETAVISYTSGTQGAPKGVMVGPHTLLFEARELAGLADSSGREVLFTILPLNHLFGLTCGVFYAMAIGAELCFAHSLAPLDIARCLVERRATQMFTVPLFLNMLKQGIEKKVAERGRLAQFVFKGLLATAQLLPMPALKPMLFKNVHQKFGGALKRFISGGAPMDPLLFDFFAAIGIPIYDGYGLTETGPVIAVNTVEHNRRGSVGRPLPGAEIHIEKTDPTAIEGEIWTRGPHVMQGYYNSPEMNAEVLTKDGWFRTGDIGYQDADGYIYITGRSKALIVLPNGKKVHPEELETLLARSSLIKETCVLGLNRSQGTGTKGEQVTAVVVPNETVLRDFGSDPKRLQEVIENEVRGLSQALATYKHASSIIVRVEPFVKTSSQKVKREVLKQELIKAQREAVAKSSPAGGRAATIGL